MSSVDIDSLNSQFSIPNHIKFTPGPGDLPIAELTTNAGEAIICLLGAHVIHFKPRGEDPVLWLSKHSYFETGKEIRGGIPICWPWFAVHPTDKSKPLHGFVRSRMWNVMDTNTDDNDNVQIRMGITGNEQTRMIWPHAFDLQAVITLGKSITVKLITKNTGNSPFTLSGALHSYFVLNDIRSTEIIGLENCDYIDKVDSMARKTQTGHIRIAEEVDRVYIDTEADTIIDDPINQRRVRISKKGSKTTVVWNPWIDKAARMADFGDTEYTGMVCVETANAADDVYEVAPGEEHRLEAIISVEPLICDE